MADKDTKTSVAAVEKAAANGADLGKIEASEVDDKKRLRIEKFIGEYASTHSEGVSMRRAFEENMSVEDFTEKFLAKSARGIAVGRLFVHRVKDVIG